MFILQYNFISHNILYFIATFSRNCIYISQWNYFSQILFCSVILYLIANYNLFMLLHLYLTMGLYISQIDFVSHSATLFLILNFISQIIFCIFYSEAKTGFHIHSKHNLFLWCLLCQKIQNWLTSKLSTRHLLINWHAFFFIGIKNASHISVFISRLCLAFHYHILPSKNDSTSVHPRTSAVSCSFCSVRRSNET